MYQYKSLVSTGTQIYFFSLTNTVHYDSHNNGSSRLLLPTQAYSKLPPKDYYTTELFPNLKLLACKVIFQNLFFFRQKLMMSQNDWLVRSWVFLQVYVDCYDNRLGIGKSQKLSEITIILYDPIISFTTLSNFEISLSLLIKKRNATNKTKRSRNMSSDRKVALITGITGQDGSYLTELLLEKGYTVRMIIRVSINFL